MGLVRCSHRLGLRQTWANSKWHGSILEAGLHLLCIDSQQTVSNCVCESCRNGMCSLLGRPRVAITWSVCFMTIYKCSSCFGSNHVFSDLGWTLLTVGTNHSHTSKRYLHRRIAGMCDIVSICLFFRWKDVGLECK